MQNTESIDISEHKYVHYKDIHLFFLNLLMFYLVVRISCHERKYINAQILMYRYRCNSPKT